ncbi:hypothetical protein K6U37_14910 [Vibrio parahaemolyticus]|uniref:RelA/SpoT domain-containing protein n=1 Tax=Vibrio parahaemolyticus TaxID=670 RepID=UPI001EECC27A|nr:hypothetical protein [Vibrio parahaemolyticus]MCG6490226.1 hypothetical protein [Vibrio parahaemolyticus]
MSKDSYELDFLQEMNLDPDLVEKSGLSVDVLISISQDYKDNQLMLMDEAEYIAKKIQRCNAVHSVRWRLKDISHLLNKIVRKRTEDKPVEKYENISVDNYKTIITDLIGVRAIYLFKKDWLDVHNHILSRWELKKDEPVTIYHRDGDIMDIYLNHNECEQKIHKFNYRSIHYVIPATKYDDNNIIFCEVQTRTIFEEGWSEIDHQVRYPDYSDDDNLRRYLSIFNRMAGGADEMGSYVNDLIALIEDNNKLALERSQNEQKLKEEKIILENEITKLSENNNNFEEIKQAYDQLIDIHRQEIKNLNIELQAKYDEEIILNRTKLPVSKLIYQNTNVNSKTIKSGTLKIKVLRKNKFASFAGQFKPPFEKIPEVVVKLIKTTVPETDDSNLEIKLGVGKVNDFNLHISNKMLGYVEPGEYEFSYEATMPE